MKSSGADDAVIDYSQRALASAKHTQPKTLRWTGGIILGIAAVNEVIPPPTAPQFFAMLLVFGVGLSLLGRLLAWDRIPARAVQVTYCLAMVVLYVSLLLMYRNRPVGWDFAYLAALMTSFGPLTFGWVAYVSSSLVMFGATAWTLDVIGTPNAHDWLISLIGAFVIGAYLLDLRLELLREVAQAEYAREQLVQTDALTGLLNRRGLASRIETVWAGALRREEAVNVAFIDIVGLKRDNDTHGHEFGDRVIIEAARAIRETVRGEDLVARWGGDEFVVVAKGDVSSAAALQARIVATLKTRAAAFAGGWHGEVTVGTASGAADALSFDQLLEQADQAMYAVRSQRQG